MTSDALLEKFEKADRQLQLKFLVGLIHWLTILARDWYNQPEKSEKLEIINEYIHRIAGHLMHLVSNDEPIEAGRVSGISTIIEQLHTSILAKLSKTLESQNKETEK